MENTESDNREIIEKKENPDGIQIIKYRVKDSLYRINSEVYTLDANGTLKHVEYFFDSNFSKPFYQADIESTEKGSIQKLIYSVPYHKKIYSNINFLNKKDKLIKQLCYSDKNFKDFCLTVKYKYNKNGTYQRRYIYEKKPDENVMSAIINVSEDNKFLSGKYYSDKNFKNLTKTIQVKYDKNGKFKEEIICKNTGKIEIYNKKNKLIREENYIDNNFKELTSTIYYIYDKNGLIKKKTVYGKKNWYMSTIKHYNEDNKIIYMQLFSDKNFKNKLCRTFYEYKSNGNYIKKNVADKDFGNGIFSIKEEYDINNKLISKKYYKSNNFKNLVCEENYIYDNNQTRKKIKYYNKNGTYQRRYIYEKNTDKNVMSAIINISKDNKFLSGEYYSDKNFKNKLFRTFYEYRSNGNYIKKNVADKDFGNGIFSIKEEYDINNKLISKKYYKSNNFKNLVCEENYIYDNKQTRRKVKYYNKKEIS